MAGLDGYQEVSDSLQEAYTSYSGVDMKLTIAESGKVLSNVQGFSVSITREKAPIYTIGGVDPRSFSRGKRAIVGSLVLVLFDQHVLLSGSDDDVAGGFADTTAYLDAEEGNLAWLNQTSTNLGIDVSADIDILNPVNTAEPNAGLEGAYGWKAPSYMDQIPPTNLVATAANEYGSRSKMGIIGLEFLNEGFASSIDDIQTNQQYTYVCRGIMPWVRVDRA